MASFPRGSHAFQSKRPREMVNILIESWKEPTPGPQVGFCKRGGGGGVRSSL